VPVYSLTKSQIEEGAAPIALATKRIPEGLVPLASYIQNLNEFRFAVQVVQ
jgi:isocitrate lyase